MIEYVGATAAGVLPSRESIAPRQRGDYSSRANACGTANGPNPTDATAELRHPAPLNLLQLITALLSRPHRNRAESIGVLRLTHSTPFCKKTKRLKNKAKVSSCST
jgi:hypothetical protein